MATKKTALPAEKRLRIWLRDDKKCVFCSNPVSFEKMTVDHLKAKSDGGTNHEHNLGTCCFECNQAKGSKTVLEFETYIQNVHHLLRTDPKFQMLLRHYDVKIKRRSNFVQRVREIIVR